MDALPLGVGMIVVPVAIVIVGLIAKGLLWALVPAIRSKSKNGSEE